ncbi:MAG: helix-turn-helix transcriptional regulator [Aristaeellaceae bacterium]
MKNLKRYRTESGMSQAQLSEASGISLRTIRGYEQGTNDINRGEAIGLYKLAKALGCRMEQLLELEVPKTSMTVTQALFLFAEHLPRYTDQCLELVRHIELGDKELFSQKGIQFISAHMEEDPDFPVEVQQQLQQVIDRWMEEHASDE